MEIDLVILEVVGGGVVSALGGVVVYIKKQLKSLDETRDELTKAKVRIARLEAFLERHEDDIVKGIAKHKKRRYETD